MREKIHLKPDETLPVVGYLEIAQRAGVTRSTVSDWRRRYSDFPTPVAELHVGPIFWWPQVKQWLQRTGRSWDANWSLEQVRSSGMRWPKGQEGG